MIIDLLQKRLQLATDRIRDLGYFVHLETEQVVFGREGSGAIATLLMRPEETMKICFAVDSYGLDAAEICLELAGVGQMEMSDPFYADFDGNLYFGEEAFEQHMIAELAEEAEEQKRVLAAVAMGEADGTATT